jgi:hypothetical protein
MVEYHRSNQFMYQLHTHLYNLYSATWFGHFGHHHVSYFTLTIYLYLTYSFTITIVYTFYNFFGGRLYTRLIVGLCILSRVYHQYFD